MSGKYWDVSWNVVTGCTPVSEACEHCWAQPWAARMAAAGIERYQRCGFRPTFHEDELMRPFKWRKPRTIFVALMGDLFHEQITDEQLDRVFAVIALTPQHCYLLCTKRPERMAAYLEGLLERGGLTEARKALGGQLLDGLEIVARLKQGPLANVWCGFTAENQQRLDERASHVLRLAAAGWHTWVSYEPALGSINFRRYFAANEWDCSCGWAGFSPDDQCPKCWAHGQFLPAEPGSDEARCTECGHVFWVEDYLQVCPECGQDSVCGSCDDERPWHGHGLDWVVCGGETGKGARAMELDWARAVCNQCVAAGVPFWFKQHGPARMGAYARMLDGQEYNGRPW